MAPQVTSPRTEGLNRLHPLSRLHCNFPVIGLQQLMLAPENPKKNAFLQDQLCHITRSTAIRQISTSMRSQDGALFERMLLSDRLQKPVRLSMANLVMLKVGEILKPLRLTDNLFLASLKYFQSIQAVPTVGSTNTNRILHAPTGHTMLSHSKQAKQAGH